MKNVIYDFRNTLIVLPKDDLQKNKHKVYDL